MRARPERVRGEGRKDHARLLAHGAGTSHRETGWKRQGEHRHQHSTGGSPSACLCYCCFTGLGVGRKHAACPALKGEDTRRKNPPDGFFQDLSCSLTSFRFPAPGAWAVAALYRGASVDTAYCWRKPQRAGAGGSSPNSRHHACPWRAAHASRPGEHTDRTSQSKTPQGRQINPFPASAEVGKRVRAWLLTIRALKPLRSWGSLTDLLPLNTVRQGEAPRCTREPAQELDLELEHAGSVM